MAAPAESAAAAARRRRTTMQRAVHTIRERGPGWLGSALVHALVLFVVANIAIAVHEPHRMRAILVTLGLREADVPGETDTPTDSLKKPAPSTDTKQPSETETPVAGDTPNAAPAPAPAAEPAPENAAGPGDQGTPNAAAPPPPHSAYAHRTADGKADALRRYGGSSETEQAVELGLGWLARHQQPNGRWAGAMFDSRCPVHDKCGNGGWDGYDVAHTALALLCFLGAGHLPGSEPYGGAVEQGLAFLLAAQNVDGSIGPQGSTNQMYNHGMASLALCEATALTADPNLRAAAKRAIGYVCGAQQPGGGWDYRGTRTDRNDLSVTGWQVMSLKSALVCGLDVPKGVLARARAYCWRARNAATGDRRSNGEYEYADRGFRGFGQEVRFGPGMTAVGLLCHLYLDVEPGDPNLGLSANRIASEPPDWQRLQTDELHTVYYWYYGTLALFQWGGEPWREWNQHLRQALLPHQRRDGHAAGSWDPVECWLGQYGGRLYATTFNILNLEVYYRYLPIYRSLGRAPTPDPLDIVSTDDALKKIEDTSPGVRFAAAQKLAETEGAEAFKALKTALADANSMVRWQAIKALGERPEAEATDLLLQQLAREDGDLRRVVVDVLGKRGDQKAFPACVRALADADAEVRRRAARALGRLTGQDFGSDAAAWRRWWDETQRRAGR